MMADTSRLIARVVARDPPAGLTLAQWIVWRCLEDRRMEREMDEQREAFYERLAGTTLH